MLTLCQFDFVHNLVDCGADSIEVLTQLASLLTAFNIAPALELRLDKFKRLPVWPISPCQKVRTAVITGPKRMLLAGAVFSARAYDRWRSDVFDDDWDVDGLASDRIGNCPLKK